MSFLLQILLSAMDSLFAPAAVSAAIGKDCSMCTQFLLWQPSFHS